MKKRTFVIALMLLTLAGRAYAAWGMENWKESQMASSSYGEKTGAMALNGLARIVAAIPEIVYYPYAETAIEKGGVEGFFRGLGMGLYHLGEDVVVGVANLVSSPVPGYHGISGLNRSK
ncbi:MAG: hypothetical protein A2Y02_00205 [Omnitrophica bacterium GWA2_52_12]|nr:MAG: hypothetical protein A2Y02_00205 [Omnitrophica bacterium GWA2_52_12]